MKKAKCNCFSEKKMICNQEVYPFIDVPMFGHETWSSTGKIETFSVQLEHNFCPQCGKPYVEK